MNRSKKNKFARALVTLSLPITTATVTGNANAACAPVAPVTDSTVTCTGAINNQNGTIGYGDVADARNTINVIAGASVTGTNLGIRLTGSGIFANADTVNNFGVISGADGIFGLSGIVNNGTGATIAGTGVNGVGYLIFAQGTLTNSGTISGTDRGVAIQNGTVTNNTTGTISGGNTGVIIQDENLQGIDVPTIINAGSITGGTTGVRFHSASGAPGDLTNSGTISATGADGVAAAFDQSGTVTNTGTIRATGFGSFGVQAADNLVVNNAGGGVISGRFIGVQAGGTATVNNAQGALIEATEPSFGASAIFGSSVSVENSGTIRALGASAAAIVAGDGVLSVSNTSTGVIAGTRGAVSSSGGVKVTGNEGLIESNSSTSFAVAGQKDVSVINGSGTIRAIGRNSIAIASNGTATVANGGGLIQTTDQDSFTVFGNNVKMMGNAGTIESNGVNGIAVGARVTADVTNSGTIQSTGDNGKAIQAANVVINNNAGGTIVGNSGAIRMDTGTINNAGTLSSTKAGSVSTIRSTVQASVNNFGTIFGAPSGFAIQGDSGSLDVHNAGLISGIDNAIGIEAANVNVINTGTINTGSHAIVATAGNIENQGTISSGSTGIALGTGRVANIGAIQAVGNGINLQNGTINNSGSIQSTATAVFSLNAFNVVNLGTISGNIALQALGQNNVGSGITNAGNITGTGGTAIKLSPAADTLTLLPGSRIIGLIDMGGGSDTININNIVPASRVSSLTTLLPVNAILQNVINFTGTLNATPVGTPSGMPSVASQTQFATLDPTAFGQADRALMNFTGGISSLVQGRLGGTAASGSAVQVVSFAPTGASGRTEAAFAAISAMGYASGRTKPLAHPFTYADAPYNVWTSGFGGTSTQKGDNTMLGSVASAGAGVIGVDRQVRPDLLIGAFAGGGAGRLSVELNSQSVDTDYVTGGIYGRFDWISHFLDFTLQGGATANKSKRLVLNDAAPGGSETATASYDSWYISPEIAYGRRYQFANGYTLTPLGRVRYLVSRFDGYNEAGSAQNLTVGRRNLHDLEERAEVELSKITGVGVGSFRTSVHGGLIALQRLGNPTINTVLIGQDLSFTTPGKASTAGVVAGAGFDFRATDRMSLFGAFEATLMSDHTRTAAAKAGLKLAF